MDHGAVIVVVAAVPRQWTRTRAQGGAHRENSPPNPETNPRVSRRDQEGWRTRRGALFDHRVLADPRAGSNPTRGRHGDCSDEDGVARAEHDIVQTSIVIDHARLYDTIIQSAYA